MKRIRISVPKNDKPGREPSIPLTTKDRSILLESLIVKLIHECRSTSFEIEYNEGESFLSIIEKDEEDTQESVKRKIDIVKIDNTIKPSKINLTCNCPDYILGKKGQCIHTITVHDLNEKGRKHIPLEGHLRKSASVQATPSEAFCDILAGVSERIKGLRNYFYFSSSIGRIFSVRPFSVDQEEFWSSLGLSFLNDHVVISDMEKLKTGMRNADSRVFFSPSFVAYIILNLEAVFRLKHQEKVDSFLAENPNFDFSCYNGSTLRLYPFQQEGVKHLVRCGRGIVADQMGLGKTPTAIGACESLSIILKKKPLRVLVVTLASVKDQWGREIKKFCNRDAVVLQKVSDYKKYSDMIKEKKEDNVSYLVVNYESLVKYFDKLKSLDFDVLVLDEVQKLKSDETIAWSNVYNLRIPYVFALSGTLLENNFDDVYSVMRIVDMNVLGPQWEFDWKYKNVSYFGDRPKGYKNINELRKSLRPYIIRRKTEDVLAGLLMDMKEEKIYVDMSPMQIKRHDFHLSIAQEIAAKMSNGRLYTSIQASSIALIANFLRCRQAASDIRLVFSEDKRTEKILEIIPPKFLELEKLIRQKCINENKKILVFTEFEEQQKLISSYLESELSIKPTILNGSVPTKLRSSLIENFENDPSERVFLSTDAGGTGLNLQFMSDIIHFDIPWNPAKVDQRNGRCYRLGQKNDVNIYYLIAKRSIEEALDHVLDSKRAMRYSVLDVDSESDEIGNKSIIKIFMEILSGYTPTK